MPVTKSVIDHLRIGFFWGAEKELTSFRVLAQPPKAPISNLGSVQREYRVSLDDNTCIARCRAGDESAFKELVERYQRKVYGVAHGMLQNGEDAMDVTQEAFIRVHRYLHHFKGTSSFFTWLYRITINLCIDHLRKESKAQTVDYNDAIDHSEQEPVQGLPWSMDNPVRAMDRKELREMIERSLKALSSKHRAVILMREIQGLSYSEMAEVMTCSKGTIMSRLFHARKRMQEALKLEMAEKKTV